MPAPVSSPPLARQPDRAVGDWLVVVGLAAVVTWTTLCLGGYLAGTLLVTTVAISALALTGGTLWLWRKDSAWSIHRAALWPLPFLAYALASVLWLSPARWLAWREWLVWWQMWLVFVLVLHFGRGRRQTALVVGTFVALGLVGVVMATYQRFVNPAWMMLGKIQADQFVGRSAGMFGVPNSLAALLELMAPACLCLLFSRSASRATKVGLGAIAALFLFAIVLTGSRGGWIGLGTAMLLWPLLGTWSWRRKLATAAAVVVLAVGALWALYHHSFYARERIRPFLEGRFEPSRPIIWKAGVQIWHRQPWLGTGAASYNVLFDQYRPRGFFDEPIWTHNDYLNTLSDYGVGGFLLWAGAGAALLAAGWREVKRARREARKGDLFGSSKWRFGLLLGLFAFAVHLAVDFHTKLPALAFAAAISFALLLRDDPAAWRTCSRRTGGFVVGLGAILVTLLTWRIAIPLLRAEALRFESRRAIDRYAATGAGDFDALIPAARANFTRAVRIDPTHGQAWADLAYATVQSWRLPGADQVSLGRFAELAADRALQLCPVNAEFWVRKGTALDLQRGRPEAESCFRRAVELAPNSAVWWYHYAFHLQAFPNRKADALQALETCLTLDPSYDAADSLRRQLVTRR